MRKAQELPHDVRVGFIAKVATDEIGAVNVQYFMVNNFLNLIQPDWAGNLFIR